MAAFLVFWTALGCYLESRRLEKRHVIGRGCGRCTASKSMAEGVEREIVLVGRNQCDVVMPAGFYQKVRHLLFPHNNAQK